MEKFFKLKQYGTDVRTEIIAGITTFFTMAYIIFVNPNILSLTGMPREGVYMATIIASVIGTLMMALYANLPYAQAPGMGLNAFFTFTVCFALGFTWQQALAIVLICGMVGMLLTISGIRKMLVQAIPSFLKSAITAGIGLFIAYIGIKEAGLLKFTADPGTYAFLGKTPADATVIAGSGTVPGLVNFSNPAVVVALIGIIITIVLMVLKVRGSILLGIISTFVISLITIACGADAKYFFPFMEKGSGINDVFGSINLSFSQMGKDIASVKETAFKIDFAGLFTSTTKIFLSIAAVISFVLADIFDTIGTLIGTGKRSGLFSDEEINMEGDVKNSRLNKALFADLTASSVGAFFGTSNVTTYIESAAGISEGGRTGLTSVVTAIMFALCIPLVSIIGIIPAVATAPALIIVGVLMMSAVLEIDWKDIGVAAVSFFAIVFMPFAYSITTGIAMGFILYVIVQLFVGKIKKVHPLMFVCVALFIVNYIFLAIRNL